jgi:hypothetical protein
MRHGICRHVSREVTPGPGAALQVRLNASVLTAGRKGNCCVWRGPGGLLPLQEPSLDQPPAVQVVAFVVDQVRTGFSSISMGLFVVNFTVGSIYIHAAPAPPLSLGNRQ